MRVAVFGRPGGGKSTLSRQIAAVANLPLHPLDLIQFSSGGGKVPDDSFQKRHSEILRSERWVIDGLGSLPSFEERLRAADVLVYVDRPQALHYWWVTKRLLKSPFTKPLGWPERSPMLSSTIASYRFLRLSHRFWTPALRERILSLGPAKRVYVIARQSDADAMLNELKRLAGARRAT